MLLLLPLFDKVSVIITFSIMCMLMSLLGFDGGPKTRLRNLTDKSLDVQIRVGSILMKAYKLGPGGSKTLKRNNIYKRYAPRGKSTLYCEGSCEPYVWIHSSTASWATARQQYVSLEDLQACREMKICKDSKYGGGFSVLKVSRAKND